MSTTRRLRAQQLSEELLDYKRRPRGPNTLVVVRDDEDEEWTGEEEAKMQTKRLTTSGNFPEDQN